MTDTSTTSKVLPDELMNSVLGKLYDTLTSGDGEFLAQRDAFFTWCTPGWPVPEDQFDFMTGFLPPGEETQEREAEAARRFALAADFSALVDFVPNVEGVFDEEDQTNVLTRGRATVSGEYERVLTQSEVAEQELTEEQEEKLARFRDLLVTTREEEDLISGETKTVTDDSDLVKRYDEKLAAYEAAALAFNNARIEALSGSVDGAAARFAINGPILGRKVRAALDDWEAAGHRNEVDQIRAYIAQVTGRSMVLYKQDLVERFERGKMTDASGGLEFLYTALTPANVLRSSGWTRFTFTREMVDEFSQKRASSWKAGGAGHFGITLGGKGSGSRERYDKAVDTSDFELSFELAQMPIRRPWMAQELYESTGWRFPDGQAPLSDGEEPPSGALVAYPETMILARDVTLKFAELEDETSEVTKQLEGKGGLSWGLVHLGGDYERSSGTERHHRESESQGIRVPGAQVIGFRCYLLPQAPNPSDDVERWT